MKAKITTAANIPAATRRAVYRRDGYRCALCDDVRGLQIHQRADKAQRRGGRASECRAPRAHG